MIRSIIIIAQVTSIALALALSTHIGTAKTGAPAKNSAPAKINPAANHAGIRATI